MTLMEQIITIVICTIYSIIAILDLSRQSPDSRLYSLPWQSIACGDVWDVSGVLL